MAKSHLTTNVHLKKTKDREDKQVLSGSVTSGREESKWRGKEGKYAQCTL
jgi:hypothetical protein